MSTRGLYGWYQAGVSHLTYNHYDSYIDGLGVDIRNFVQHVTKTKQWDVFRAHVQNLTIVKDTDKVPHHIIEQYKNASFFPQFKTKNIDWYFFLNNIQGVDTLYAILSG